jgi:hypothetical protein
VRVGEHDCAIGPNTGTDFPLGSIAMHGVASHATVVSSLLCESTRRHPLMFGFEGQDQFLSLAVLRRSSTQSRLRQSVRLRLALLLLLLTAFTGKGSPRPSPTLSIDVGLAQIVEIRIVPEPEGPIAPAFERVPSQGGRSLSEISDFVPFTFAP